MKLFEYTIFFTPKDSKGKVIRKDCKVLVPITEILAADENEVKVLAARKIDESYLDRLDEITVGVRSFL